MKTLITILGLVCLAQFCFIIIRGWAVIQLRAELEVMRERSTKQYIERKGLRAVIRDLRSDLELTKAAKEAAEKQYGEAVNFYEEKLERLS